MIVPPGALPRAALVAIPLALVVLIFVTPSLLVRPGETRATDTPSLIVEFTGDPWPDPSTNESAILYVRSALGLPLYEFIGFNVTGANPPVNSTEFRCGAGGWADSNWTCADVRVPSVWLKLPAIDGNSVNVSALTVHGTTRFWYNATFVFVWGVPSWILQVTPEGDETSFDNPVRFTTSMRPEASP